MKPLEHIRKNLFSVSQAAFSEIAGVTQATVSRWESGELEPGRAEMAAIREEALRRDIQWNDRLFFEAPPLQTEASS